MKIGIILSAVIVVILVVVMLVATKVSVDERTSYSGPKTLVAQNFSKLPALMDLPAGDASAIYDEMISFYNQNSTALDALESVSVELEEKALDLIIKAAETGTVTAKYLDSKVPMVPNAVPDFKGAFQILAVVAMTRAKDLHDEKGNAAKQERAIKGGKATFVLGHELFQKSNRLAVRNMGISIMMTSGEMLFQWAAEGDTLAKNLLLWTDAINQLNEHWRPKHEVVYSLRLKTADMRATVGDLIAIAELDQDLSWRVEATLALGRAKFMPGSGPDNRAGILAALTKLVADKEPLVADAAKVAEAFTKEDVKKMN